MADMDLEQELKFELGAIRRIRRILEKLEPRVRNRVLAYLANLEWEANDGAES